jgi:NAD(P)-dependent dehydrogenase (short-subunit alcohol dehydrogenase family)
VSSDKWTAADIPSQEGRTAIVTGANSGIGLAAARELGRAGARVVLAVRDRAKGERAAQAVDGDAEVRELDLSDLDSVRAFAEAWEGSVEILVNNAGVMAPPKSRTKDGFELQIGTNHLGHFALTNLLLPQITDRVVTVSSTAHWIGRVDIEDLNWERRRYSRWPAYAQSKLANLLFTLELQRRLDEADSRVRAVAAHPGYAATNLQSHTQNFIQGAFMRVTNLVIAQSEEMGALPTLYAATVDIPGGSYVGPDGFREQRGHPKLVGRTSAARDADTARELWDLSEKLTGVSFSPAAPPRADAPAS